MGVQVTIANRKELTQQIDAVLEQANDPEAAHLYEDIINEVLIDTYCPEWVQEELSRLRQADFPRWYA